MQQLRKDFDEIIFTLTTCNSFPYIGIINSHLSNEEVRWFLCYFFDYSGRDEVINVMKSYIKKVDLNMMEKAYIVMKFTIV